MSERFPGLTPFGFEDAFGYAAVKNTQQNLNVPSHYGANAERVRVYRNGTRQQIEYNSTPVYEHVGPHHILKPAAGDLVALETTERPRYQVQFEFVASFAWGINQELQDGDHVRIGPFDGTDGWLLELRGDHQDGMCTLWIFDDGTLKAEERGVLYKDPVKTFTQFACRTSWYRVGAPKWTQFYTEDGKEMKEPIGSTSIDTKGGPQQGNLPLRVEVKASNTTDNLEMQAGSMAHITLGDTEDNFRTKSAPFNATVSSTDVWVPIRAFRIEPDRRNINTQIVESQLLSFTGNDEVVLQMNAFDETNVEFGTDGWSVPEYWSENNNPLRSRTDVNSIVDEAGTTASAPLDPGGYQLSQAVLTPTDATQFQKGSSDARQNQKRVLATRDIAVLMIRAQSTGDISYAQTWELDF